MKLFYSLILISTLFISNSFCQTLKDSFYLKNHRATDNTEYYTSLISKANMESYRLKDKEVVLQFEEGFQCVLISAASLQQKHPEINSSAYPKEFPENFKMPIFSFLPEGSIHAKYEKVSK